VDEQEITSSSELRSARRAYRAGDSAELTVYRNGDYITLTIVFDEEKQQSQTETENQQVQTQQPQTQQPQTQQPQTQQPQETQPQTPEDGGQVDTWSFEIPDLFKDLFPGYGG
jgi:heme-binding NEAT domain protein